MSLDDLFFPPSEALWMRKLKHPLGSLPVNEINQTWLSTYRKCNRKGFLFGAHERSRSPYYMFNGSVFHVAADDAVTAPDMNRWLHNTYDPRYWDDVFQRVWAFNSKQSYEVIDYDKYKMRLISKDTFKGTSVGMLIYFGLTMLAASGFEVVASEKRMKLEIPGGTPFLGTLDLQLKHKQIGLIICDTKTEGMAKTMFFGGTTSKSSYQPAQVASHTQLTHYAWMGYRLGMWEPEDIGQYMIFTPTNLTKYVKGTKAGQMKGPPFHFGIPHPRNVYRYEEDLAAWLKMAAAGNYARMYPSTFGKLDCLTCPWAKPCLEDKSSDEVPDYIREG